MSVIDDAMTRADLRRPVGHSVALDFDRLHQHGFASPARGRNVHTEEFRRIKQHLLEIARSGDGPRERSTLIGVTSALPGEGKTSTAINLALSVAMEIDTSVLLVDADVLRPDLLARLGVDARPGLLDLLATRGMAPEELVLRTNVPKLSVLPAGRRRQDAAELIASRSMDDLLDSLACSGPAHIVIFDSPPLLLSNEARALARSMGQVLVVVEANRTPRSAIIETFAALEDCPHVATILNKTSRAQNYGYGDYYGE